MSARRVGVVAVVAVVGGSLGLSPALASVGESSRVRAVQQISRDTLPPTPGAEPDTQAEPDVAIDPHDPKVVVAVFQQGRYPDGASQAPGYAWSHDGGRTWRHGTLPHLTVS